MIFSSICPSAHLLILTYYTSKVEAFLIEKSSISSSKTIGYLSKIPIDKNPNSFK
jgi:hypothetical protein